MYIDKSQHIMYYLHPWSYGVRSILLCLTLLLINALKTNKNVIGFIFSLCNKFARTATLRAINLKIKDE